MKSNAALGGLETTLLQIAFVVLKLCHVIDWSWWWVLSPTWISVVLVIVLVLLYYLLGST